MAPKGFTALSERSISITFFAIKLSPMNPKLSGISSFNLPTKMFYKSNNCYKKENIRIIKVFFRIMKRFYF